MNHLIIVQGCVQENNRNYYYKTPQYLFFLNNKNSKKIVYLIGANLFFCVHILLFNRID